MSNEYAVQYSNGRYSCGPIVLLNALRHQGHKVTRKHLPWLAREMNSDRRGVFVGDMERAAREMGAFKRLYLNGSLEDTKIKAKLLDGNGIALRLGMEKHAHKGGGECGHYLFLAAIQVHRLKTSYLVCNIGGCCKWLSFAEVNRYYNHFYAKWWITHVWTVPLKKKKTLRIGG